MRRNQPDPPVLKVICGSNAGMVLQRFEQGKLMIESEVDYDERRTEEKGDKADKQSS